MARVATISTLSYSRSATLPTPILIAYVATSDATLVKITSYSVFGNRAITKIATRVRTARSVQLPTRSAGAT